MFLRRLLDPEEARRRRHLRARILRRNRIKKEIAQGLEPRLHRIPYDLTEHQDGYNWHESPGAAVFLPTFGGNSDARDHRQDRHVAGTLRTGGASYRPIPAISTPTTTKRKKKNEDKSETNSPTGSIGEALNVVVHSEPSTKVHKRPPQPLLPVHRSLEPPAAKPTLSKTRLRWHDAYERIIFRQHAEILAKDPKRRWRQERFGLLRFAKGEYEEAAKHLTIAITLGANSSVCWRRLAQCHFHLYEAKGDWDALWDAKDAYEQAMNHLEITCNPYALFEYARVLEVLGNYTGALSVCASILQTFPRFQWLHKVMLRFVLLQRYQFFENSTSLSGSSVLSSTTATMEAIERETILIKCVEYTNTLLLDKHIAEEEMHMVVLYMHARLNELLAASTTSAGGGTMAAQVARENADRSFEELFKIALARQIVPTHTNSPPLGLTWKTWITKSDTFIVWAGYFHDQNETIPAADALSRALDLLQVPLVHAADDITRKDTSEESRSRLSLYLALGRNYYQCNHMEKAIRSMEAVFEMNPYHEEARASLGAWFPAKWKYRLDLEDASQIQIGRVIRGIWGRNKARRRRLEVQRALEQKYKENPFHPLHRRNVLRVLRAKYAPLFLAQDMSARRIQTSARRYLYYARIRWALNDQRAKFLQQLRHFRGERVRRAYRIQRDAHRSIAKQQTEAQLRICRFVLRWYLSRRQCCNRLSTDELLFQAQQRIIHAKDFVARSLQKQYRNKKAKTLSQRSCASLREAVSQNKADLERRNTCTVKIQRAWRRFAAARELRQHQRSDRASILVQQLKRGHERQRDLGADRELAACKIQALYRGKRLRRSLCKIKRVFAPKSESPIRALVDHCEVNQREGIESFVILHALDSFKEKRALFDHAVVILDAPISTAVHKEECNGSHKFPLQHLVSAIQHSALLRCLICTCGNFQGDRIDSFLASLQNSRSLRVLALGCIETTRSDVSRPHSCQYTNSHDALPEQDDEDPAQHPSTSSETRPPAKSSAVKLLSQALRTTNFLLEELYLEDNFLLEDPFDGAQIASFLGDFFFARYGHLRKLVLVNMRFSDANTALLGPALGINTVLCHLDLHGNDIRNDAAIAIATHGLAHNRHLTYLNIADNAIGSPGAIALFNCLATQNQTLETLILCNNNALNDVMPAFLAMWQSNATILRVDLRGNLIHSDHLDAIAAAVQERSAASVEPELRLFLARKRFSATVKTTSTSSSGRAGSPLKITGSNRKGKPSPLSPKAWLRKYAQQNASPTTLINSPMAVYKQEQYQHSEALSAAQSARSVPALISPQRAPHGRKKPPHAHATTTTTKLPAIVMPLSKRQTTMQHCMKSDGVKYAT